jgi:catechol 2,3-dioxygenase-like lactoylglutathione lyase family enzyme
MKPRITLFTLGVDDLERAVRFYRDGLGLKTEGIVGADFEYGAVAFFDLQAGLKLALWPRASIARDTGIARSSPSKREGCPSRSSLTPPCGTTAVGSSGTTHRTCARLFDADPIDMPSRVQSLVHAALHRYIDLFIPSLQWIPWPPLAGALRFSTFIGTMDS